MPDESARKYHIGFAKASLETLFDDIGEALRESWKPGADIIRYGRRWYLTKVVHESIQLYFGRIGFVKDDEFSTLRFNPLTNDFEYGEAPSGVVVPFVIQKSDGVIAFQLYPGVVRETTFTGALQQLLNDASHVHVWRVQSFVEDRSFEEWLSTTEVVSKFDFALERPNPNYAHRPFVEEMIEGMDLRLGKIGGRAREGDSVNVNSDLFQQALDHVILDYGKAKVSGQDREGAETTWMKVQGAVGRVASKRTRSGFGNEQAPEELLQEVLAEAPLGRGLIDADSHFDDD